MTVLCLQYIFLYLGVEAWHFSFIYNLHNLGPGKFTCLGTGFLKNEEEITSLNSQDGGTVDEMYRKMPNPTLG